MAAKAAEENCADVVIGGYDEPFFHPPDDDYKCQFCLLVVRDPFLTRCGHVYCEKCLPRLDKQDDRLKCPEDGELLGKEDIFPDLRLKRKILNFDVRCRVHSSGCVDIVKLQNLDDHMKTCGYALVECPNGCDQSLMRSEVVKHRTISCPNRPARCKYCYKPMEFRFIEAHEKTECANFPFSCLYCNRLMTRSTMDRHGNGTTTCCQDDISHVQSLNLLEYGEENSGSGSPLLNLPSEILMHIVSFLDVDAIPSVMLSCRKLHELTNDETTWKRIYLGTWPCRKEVWLHPTVQYILKANTWRESTIYRCGFYRRLRLMINYRRFQEEIDRGKYSCYARALTVESLMACLLAVGIFGVPGVDEQRRWREHQRVALHYVMRDFKMHSRVEDVLRVAFVDDESYRVDVDGPGLRTFLQYTDYAREFHSSDLFGCVWNVGMLQMHGLTTPGQRDATVMNERSKRSLYSILDCTAKRPSTFLCGGLLYTFSNTEDGRKGPFIIDPKDPMARRYQNEIDYTKYGDWIINHYRNMPV